MSSSETHEQARAEEIVTYAREVIEKIEKYGPSIVPHLLDTDENAGEFLRRALDTGIPCCNGSRPGFAAVPTGPDSPGWDAAKERIEQAILAVAVDDPMWIGDDGQPLDYLPEREVRLGNFIGRAALAVAAALAGGKPTDDATADGAA